MPVAQLPQGPVRYHESGPADGPVALLVHGVLVAGDVWSQVSDELARRGWRCIAPTLPLGCHTVAMPPASELSPTSVARLLIDLVGALELRDVTLVGNDTGGALCQFAVDLDPSLFAALVLTNCDLFTSFPPAPFGALIRVAQHPRLLRALYAPMRWAPVRRLAYRVLAREPFPGDMTARWWAGYYADAAIRHDTQRFLAAVDAAALDQVTRRLPSFDGPVRLCWGSEDRIFGDELGQRLHATLPDSTFVPVSRSRTFVMWDRPDAVVDAVVSVRSGQS